MQLYSHLFIGDDDILQYYNNTHTVIAKIDSFDRIEIDLKAFIPIQILTKPKIWILKKHRFVR